MSFKDVDRTDPRVSVDAGDEPVFDTRPNISRSEVRRHAGNLIVKMNSMAEIKRPQITLVMFMPINSGTNNHGASGLNNGLYGVFCNTVVMVPTNDTVLDTFTFCVKFTREIFGGVDAIVGEIVLG